MQNNRIVQLRKLKIKLGISYDALAHELGVHTFTAYRWLQKGVVPRSRLALRAIDQFLKKNRDRSQRRQGRQLEQKPVRQFADTIKGSG